MAGRLEQKYHREDPLALVCVFLFLHHLILKSLQQEENNFGFHLINIDNLLSIFGFVDYEHYQ